MNRTLESALPSKYNFQRQCFSKENERVVCSGLFVCFLFFLFFANGFQNASCVASKTKLFCPWDFFFFCYSRYPKVYSH